MLDELRRILAECRDYRKRVEGNPDGYFYDNYEVLYTFIKKKLKKSFFRNNANNAKIIAEHFDEILPFINNCGTDILILYFELLRNQENFKERFDEGIRNYLYKDNVEDMLFVIHSIIPDEARDDFFDRKLVESLIALGANSNTYTEILNRAGEERQRELLQVLVENGVNIHYSGIRYKGDNKQIIYDNLPLFLENAKNLYALRKFVGDNPEALKQVNDYIDSHEEQAMNSIFCETQDMTVISNPVLKDVIKMIIKELMEKGNVKFSDIDYNGGGFSRIIMIGDKVLKIGDRYTPSFPNNPFIVSPLLRRELSSGEDTVFVEVTERVDTSVRATEEELYQLYKNLRELGLIWADIKPANVGRLLRDNVIHWNDDIDPSDSVLTLADRRGERVLKAGEWVILDSDFIFDENDPTICYSNQRERSMKFEERYQREKKAEESKKGGSSSL